MPDTMTYDPARETIIIGTGEVSPVALEVWDYTVGGRRVVKSWFDYRKAEPGGRKSSPLDVVNPRSWPSSWTTDLLDLLTVLDRLTRLEAVQGHLLREVLDGGLLTRSALTTAGVAWPSTKADRQPRRALQAGSTQMSLADF